MNNLGYFFLGIFTITMINSYFDHYSIKRKEIDTELAKAKELVLRAEAQKEHWENKNKQRSD